MAGSIQRWCKCAMDHDTEHRANHERHGPEEVPEPVYLLPVLDRGANAAEEGADLEVPDDATVGNAREKELHERDGNEEPAADDDGEDADDEATHEEQRRFARKQPGRERANRRGRRKCHTSAIGSLRLVLGVEFSHAVRAYSVSEFRLGAGLDVAFQGLPPLVFILFILNFLQDALMGSSPRQTDQASLHLHGSTFLTSDGFQMPLLRC